MYAVEKGNGWEGPYYVWIKRRQAVWRVHRCHYQEIDLSWTPWTQSGGQRGLIFYRFPIGLAYDLTESSKNLVWFVTTNTMCAATRFAGAVTGIQCSCIVFFIVRWRCVWCNHFFAWKTRSYINHKDRGHTKYKRPCLELMVLCIC